MLAMLATQQDQFRGRQHKQLIMGMSLVYVPAATTIQSRKANRPAIQRQQTVATLVIISHLRRGCR